MSRYIDVRPDEEGLPSELVIAVGDVVRFAATGGRIRSGTGVELLGVLSESVVGTDGSVLTPLGAPGTVLIHARSPGLAVVDVVSGDPFPGTGHPQRNRPRRPLTRARRRTGPCSSRPGRRTGPRATRVPASSHRPARRPGTSRYGTTPQTPQGRPVRDPAVTTG